jgi:antitoxin FitA
LESTQAATLTIRGLDPETHARLRVEAARHGRSMEAEVRAILQERLALTSGERGLGRRIQARFHGLEVADVHERLPAVSYRTAATR